VIPAGLLLVDKPSGPTSHDVVARIRRLSGQRRIGHSGTLDPPASGLLLLALGSATRLIRFLPQAPKIYTGALRLGIRTSTDDLTGETLERTAAPLPSPSAVLAAAEEFKGASMQRPPDVSARKIDGQRMYRLARSGQRVEPAATPVEVFRLELQPGDLPGQYRFLTEVSSGTYIRALARDLGEKLGCGGALEELRRTGIGPLAVADACPLDELERLEREALEQRIVPLDALPLEPPIALLCVADDARRFRQGGPVEVTELPDSGYCRVVDRGGRLLGIAESRDGLAHPKVVLC